jgi:antitoxin ParD1/3/4
MAQNTSITLGEHFQALTSRLVSEGRYGSVSEAVRAGLRLLEEHEARVRALRQAILDGERSGFPDEPFDFDVFLTRMQAKHGARD